jgi:hypothetical protein
VSICACVSQAFFGDRESGEIWQEYIAFVAEPTVSELTLLGIKSSLTDAAEEPVRSAFVQGELISLGDGSAYIFRILLCDRVLPSNVMQVCFARALKGPSGGITAAADVSIWSELEKMRQRYRADPSRGIPALHSKALLCDRVLPSNVMQVCLWTGQLGTFASSSPTHSRWKRALNFRCNRCSR